MRTRSCFALAACAAALALPATAAANSAPIPGQYIVVLNGAAER
jgi:hypothetical protein